MAKNMFSCQSFDPVHSASFLRSSSTARTCSCRDEIHQLDEITESTLASHYVMSIMSMYATCRIFPSTVLYCTMVATLSHIHWWHLWNPMNSCWAFHMNTRLDHGSRAYKHVWHVCAFCESLFRTSAFAQASECAAKSSRYFFVISSYKEGGDGEMHLTTTLLWRRDGYKQVHCSLFNEVSGKNPRHGQEIVVASYRFALKKWCCTVQQCNHVVVCPWMLGPACDLHLKAGVRQFSVGPSKNGTGRNYCGGLGFLWVYSTR